MKKIYVFMFAVLAVPFAALLMFGDNTRKTTPETKADAAVAITNNTRNSGGSGVILRSTMEGSDILTNAHVCGVVKRGGQIITTDRKSFPVSSYKISVNHDLCLIRVTANLGVNTAISYRLQRLGEKATVVGHPALYPTSITEGYFSDHMQITVLVGLKECTEEDLKKGDMDVLLQCVIYGGLPVFRNYDSVVVTATVMPGSSGSPVYNEDGEISGLVFAGTSNLSYGFIVPIEYVYRFIVLEAPGVTEVIPDPNLGPDFKKYSFGCDNVKDNHLKRLCKVWKALER